MPIYHDYNGIKWVSNDGDEDIFLGIIDDIRPEIYYSWLLHERLYFAFEQRWIAYLGDPNKYQFRLCSSDSLKECKRQAESLLLNIRVDLQHYMIRMGFTDPHSPSTFTQYTEKIHEGGNLDHNMLRKQTTYEKHRKKPGHITDQQKKAVYDEFVRTEKHFLDIAHEFGFDLISLVPRLWETEVDGEIKLAYEAVYEKEILVGHFLASAIVVEQEFIQPKFKQDHGISLRKAFEEGLKKLDSSKPSQILGELVDDTGMQT